MLLADEQILPPLSVDLIDELDRLFPEKSPEPGMDRETMMFEAGKRAIVRSLVARKKAVEAENEGRVLNP